MLQTIEIAPSEQVNASIIWLHGLGADAYDFVPIAEDLALTETRFIFPHAPYRKITAFNGYETRGWYDIFGLDTDSPQDVDGIVAMQAEINHLIALENQRGIPNHRILLAGFSQGGAMALHAALRYSQSLASILALSTYLPLRSQLHAQIHIANREIPIFLAHGTHDNVIQLETAKLAFDTLKLENFNVVWHEYEMAHSVCQQQILDIKKFLIHLKIN